MIEHRVGTSKRSGAVHLAAKVVIRPTLKYYPLRGPAARLMPLVDQSARLIPRGGGLVHHQIVGKTWRGELVEPIDGPTSNGAILYLHGGAFLMCGLNTHRRIVERLSRKTGMAVLSVEYRQLPDGRLADSLVDCEDAHRWLVRHGHPAHRIVLAGDSAGGHLAFATALRLRDAGLPRPAAIIGLSPWLDFDHTAKWRHHNVRRDAYIPARRLRRVARLVVGGTPQPHHSPVNADLAGLPPSLIMCGESEILRVDAELMTERLEQAGVPCALSIWEGQVHAFPVLSDLSPQSREAVAIIVDFVRDAVAASSRPVTGLASSYAGPDAAPATAGGVA